MFKNATLAQRDLRHRLLMLLGGGLLLSFTIFILITYLGLRNGLQNELDNKVEHAQHLYQVLVSQRVEVLSANMVPVLANQAFKKAYLEGDRQALFHLSQGLFDELRRNYNISHFYFHDFEGVNFLRVHQPERYGDHINRHTMRETAATLKQHAGLELGPLGTFTLRVVTPWFNGDNLIGFIEFGEEFEPIMGEAAITGGVDMLVLIDKRFLDREDWQAGMKMLARDGDWDLFTDTVLVDETRLGLARLLKKSAGDLPPRELKEVSLTAQDDIFLGRPLALKDAAGETVGQWFVLYNVTDSIATFRSGMFLVMAVCLSIATVLLVVFNRVLKRIESRLRQAYDDLELLVDERTRALQQALAEAELNREQIRVVLKSLQDPILVADEQSRVWLANRSARELFQLGDGDLRSFTFAELLDNKLNRQLATMSPVDHESLEIEIERMEAGRSRPSTYLVQTTSVALGDDNYANIFVFHDVTRTRKLDRLKSEFISNAAHELNTPLATILGYSELLLDPEQEFPEETRKEFLQTIYQKANHLNNLLGQILDISRLEAGRPIPLEVESIPLQERLESMFRHLPVIHPRHQFHLKVPEVPVTVSADPGKFTQIMENLLSNAVKYSPEGGTITLRVDEDQADGQLHFMVRDQGVGMSSEELSQAFERFYRVDASDSATRGVGLGLTITRQLVESHEGKIWIESLPGEGTEVHFTLPGSLTRNARDKAVQ